MLKVISLHTLQQIFEVEAQEKLSAMAKMSYIACLTHYFEDKPATTEFCTGFDIDRKDMKMTEATIRYFNELQDAGLVMLNDRTITFINHWNRHIDKRQVEPTADATLLNLMAYKHVREFEEELLKNEEIFELMDMKHKLKKDAVKKLMTLFIKEQSAVDKHYPNHSSCFLHFISWGAKKAPPPLIQTEIAKPSSVLIGRDKKT